MMPYALAFTLDALPPLPNRTKGQHWAVTAKSRKDWHWRVKGGVGRDKPKQPLERARVTLVRHSCSEPDEDNTMASWKPVLDGLVQAGVLADDKPSVVTLKSQWFHAPRGKGYIGISVEEILRIEA